MTKKEETLTKAQLINKLLLELHGFDVRYIQELNDEKLTDTEITARASELEIPYTRWIKKVLEMFVIVQTSKMAEVAETEQQLAYMRGAISGIILIKEWFEGQMSKAKSRFNEG